MIPTDFATFWSQAAAVPQPPDPSQLWRQFLGMWSDCWSKTFTTQTTSPDMFQTAQKMWSEQLETLAQGFANVMGTDAFSTMQSKFFEQTLAWQDRAAKAANPQVRKASSKLPKCRRVRHRRNRDPAPARVDSKETRVIALLHTAARKPGAARRMPAAGWTINGARSAVRAGNSLPAARCKPVAARTRPPSADMVADRFR